MGKNRNKNNQDEWTTVKRKPRKVKIPLILEPEELDQLSMLELLTYELLSGLKNLVPASFIAKRINDRVDHLQKLFSSGKYKIPTNSDKIGVTHQIEMTIYSKPELMEELQAFKPIMKRELGEVLYEGALADILIFDKKQVPTLWGWTKVRVKE